MDPVAILLRFVAFVLLVLPTNAFYFYSNGGERKCFHKELSKGTLIQGKYDVQTFDDSTNSYRTANSDEVSVVIDIEEIFDDNHRVVNQKGAPTGDFAFIALESGEHKICLQPQAQGWLAKIKTKTSINFEIGSDSKLDTKKKSAVQSLQNKVQILNEKVEEIKREQALVRDREALFRDASESANTRAMWWTILQIFVLGGTCAWQLRHLRSFFVKQKIL